MFADKYLARNKNIPLVADPPDRNVGIIVVIPCYREPDLADTLESLYKCILPECKIEVLVVVNHSENADREIKSFNNKTVGEAQLWVQENRREGIIFYVTGPVELPRKWAGAGLARKAGMDEAVCRFNYLQKPEGIIASLDADTLVSENYLAELVNHFQNNPVHIGATVAFRHRLEGLEPLHREGILAYEMYQKYYKEAIDFTGYPWSMYTVGSAFAVKAGAYVKRGGMNRRQAGEDFYFLQNLAQMGTIGEITRATVYPSSRVSDRVPFGTGPILQQWLQGKKDLLLTYNFKAFDDLRQFFGNKDQFFQAEEEKFDELISALPEPVSFFLIHDGFWKEIDDLNRNCSSLQSFRNRFFQKFNAFKILKFLNFGHERYYEKADLTEQVKLLQEKNKQP